MKTKEEILFEEAPVGRAVLSLVIPTVISQLITVIYNMADTFFIGQIGDPNQVAAVSLCMPMFVFLTGLANLFGIGGSSLMSRSLGTNDHQKAKRTAAFSIWTAIVVSLVYGMVLFGTRSIILPMVGADAQTYEFCCQYIFWTITIGAVPTVLNQEAGPFGTRGGTFSASQLWLGFRRCAEHYPGPYFDSPGGIGNSRCGHCHNGLQCTGHTLFYFAPCEETEYNGHFVSP